MAVSYRSLSLPGAQKLLNAALRAANYTQLTPIAICIVDRLGLQICAATMDGAAHQSTYAALERAVAAVQFKTSTIHLFHMLAEGLLTPRGTILPTPTAFLRAGGGVLVIDSESGVTLGGLGIAGQASQDNHDLARTALATMLSPEDLTFKRWV